MRQAWLVRRYGYARMKARARQAYDIGIYIVVAATVLQFFLAGLQQIPEDMYEAAALDRASRWTMFRRITLPSLRRTTVLVVMLQTAAQLQPDRPVIVYCNDYT